MEESLLFAAVAIAYALCALAPILWSGVVALWHQPVLPRRILFVCVVTALSYGAVSCATYLLNIPVTAYLSFIAPRLESSNHYSGKPFASVGVEIVRYWFLFTCFVLPLFAVTVTTYLKRRWPHIVTALRG